MKISIEIDIDEIDHDDIILHGSKENKIKQTIINSLDYISDHTAGINLDCERKTFNRITDGDGNKIGDIIISNN